MPRSRVAWLYVGVTLCGCGIEESPCGRTYNPTSVLTAVEENRTKWRAQSITAYEYESSASCFCGYRPARVRVKDGAVVSAVHLDDESPVPQPELDAYPTIEELFDYIEGAVTDHLDFVGVTFDPDLGYPTEVVLDPHCHMFDEGIAYLASDLVTIDE